MSSSNPKSQNDLIASIPIFFSNHLSSKKDILIGKVQLSDKNNFKVVPRKDAQNQTIKEYDLINDSNNYSQYTGRENAQDSNYILMKYNSKDNEIQMYPANTWINFFKSTKKVENNVDLKEKEKSLKEQQKNMNKMLKKFFNFETEMYYEEDKKKKDLKKRV